jgi:enoyl-CoA hydratase/carnithine racemase
VTGTAPTFCAGGDLGQLSQMARGGATLTTETIYSNIQALVRAIHDCQVPVLAAVNGDALGAGVDAELATLGAVQGSLLAGEDFQAMVERFATRP